MVAEAELTREVRRALTRERLVARALARGDHEMADVYRQMEFDDESTPEEDADAALFSGRHAANLTAAARNAPNNSPPAQRGEMPKAEGGCGPDSPTWLYLAKRERPPSVTP